MHAQSDSIAKLACALFKAQADLKPAAKDSTNPHFRSKYADLQSIWDAARPVLWKHELAVAQTFNETDGSKMSIVTTLMHSSGEWLRGTLTLNPTKADPQGVGSAITYGRRYALAAILGIVADEDDDGNAASARHEQTQSAPVSRPAYAKPTTPATEPAKSTATPVSGSGWKSVQIHFGKQKGRSLGELDRESLDWWINKWEPKPFQGAIQPDAQALRDALDAARADLAMGGNPELDEPLPF